MRDLSPATIAALQSDRIIHRHFIWFKATNRTTGDLETVGVGTEAVAMTVPVIRPDTGAVVDRVYQPNAGLIRMPPIPTSLKLEERRIRLEFSRLSPAIINAVKVYQVKGQPIEIHRGLFDPDTMNLVDPCHCRFDGFVKSARIKKAKVGDDGVVYLEITDHSASLRPNPIKISKAFFLGRDGDRGGDHIGADPNLSWGEKDIVKERRGRRRVRLLK